MEQESLFGNDDDNDEFTPGEPPTCDSCDSPITHGRNRQYGVCRDCEGELPEGDDRARARSTDPAESHAAAASLSPEDIRSTQLDVLVVLYKEGPSTDGEMIEAAYENGIQQSRSGLRTRRNECVEKGLVEDTGKRRKSRADNDRAVWGLTDHGRRVAEEAAS